MSIVLAVVSIGLAVLIPFALGIGGAVSGLFVKGEEGGKSKGILVSVLGIALLVIMLAVNSIIK